MSAWPAGSSAVSRCFIRPTASTSTQARRLKTGCFIILSKSSWQSIRTSLITINREDFARAQKSLKAKKVRYIPGIGIDLGRVAAAKVDATAKRAEMGIPQDALVVLSAGEMNENKNHATAIRAVASLQNSRIVYLICGDGDGEARLKAVSEECGIGAQVRFLGYRNDIFEIYQVADVFVHPSFREGLPVALMEVMTAGLPCVVSRIRGNMDLIENEKGGYTCPPADVNGFSAAIEKILSDKALSGAMGAYNKEAVRRFDRATVLAQLSKIYDDECR